MARAYDNRRRSWLVRAGRLVRNVSRKALNWPKTLHMSPADAWDATTARAPARPVSRRPWLEHWLTTVSDLSALKASHPMMDAVIDEIDGRMIRVGDQWLADFASCNYLGFDLDPEIIDRVPAFLEQVGHAPELVASARQPRAVRGDRGAADRAARFRGLARAAHDHPHPYVGDPAARRLGDDLPRRARTQDHLRRLSDRQGSRGGGAPLPLRGSRSPRFAALRRARPHPPRVHGRRQQHDRQRAGPCGVRGRWRAATARCSTSTTPTASA